MDFIGQLKPNVIEYIILNYLQQIHNIRCQQKCTFDKNTIWDVLKQQLITQYMLKYCEQGSLYLRFEVVV